MPLVIVNQPAAEPVTLDEAKLHLRVDAVEDDPLIGALISAARLHAETVTARQLMPARWKLVLDCFPGPSLMGVPAGVGFSLPGHAILIHKSPVQQIVSIRYRDMSSVWQDMPAADYVADLSSEPARITPAFGKIWPPVLPQIGSVEVLFDAGYASADQVPSGIKRWMLMRVGSLYQHREEFSVLPAGRIDPLPFVDGLLDPYRVVTI